MSVAVVSLTGTWSRTQTDRSDVYAFRRIMRRRVRANGGFFDACMPRKQPGDGLLEGTFEVEIPVGPFYRQHPQLVRTAKKLFEAMMALEMCRPPKVKYDRDAIVFRRLADGQVGALK